MKKKNFNAIIFKNKLDNGFVFLKYSRNNSVRDAFNINLQDDFMQSEFVNNTFPKHKIVLSDVKQASETDISIVPKYCVDLKLNDQPLDFWEIAENQEYLEYFMQQIYKKL